MDNLIWVIYLIDVVCKDMNGLGFLLFMFMIVSGAGYAIGHFTKDDESADPIRELPLGRVFSFCILMLFLSNLIPSQDTAYKMLAVYGVSEVSKSENVQELMGDGMDILKLTLKDYKDKLESTTKKD
tara:strand:- start:73867 stop:74247 length:381 start_codon:yes stop_codon:yes gene_type:complete